MSTLAVKGPPRPLHFRSKSSSRTNRGADSQSERDVKAARNTSRKVSGDVKDDAATIAFVRRTLCAGQLKPGMDNQSLEDLLPPLTSSNQIDLQLYAIISVIIKDFVQTWYAKITPDHEFVDEIIHIIAHCTRALEQRLRRVDLQSLLLDEIPELLNQHIEAFRAAQSAASSDVGQLLAGDFRTVYHSMHPHPALSPVPSEDVTSEVTVAQRANESIWRQLLIEGVLNHLLPPEDLQNPCQKVLVSEIFSEMIIGNVLGGKVSQGWFIWDMIAKVTPAVQPNTHTKKRSRLDQYGLLSAQASSRETSRSRPRVKSIYALIINIGWEILRIALLILGTVRTLFVQFSDAAQLPPRAARGARGDSSVASSPSIAFVPPTGPQEAADGGVTQKPATQPTQPALLEMAVWRVPMHVLGLTAKMPWLVGALSLFQHHVLYGPGRLGATDARLDRLLSHQVTSTLSSPSLLPTILCTLRAALFPNNSLAPGVPPPSTPVEIAAVKRRCAAALLATIPKPVRGVYFGRATATEEDTEETQCQILESEVLDLFSDDYANKHFLFAAVEVVVCRLFPELAVGGEGPK